MKIIEIINIMEKIADSGLAFEWDNCGVQIDAGKDDIERALIALEVSNEVIDEAIEKNADLIITHHPLIFSPFKNVDHNNIMGKYIVKLIKAGVSVYSAHTSFDEAPGGNNDYIAALLNLENIMKPENWPTGRIGELKNGMRFEDVCGMVKANLKLGHLTATGDPNANIARIGLCAGSGSDIISAAAESGCDLFITGDVKYHDARHAAEKGLCLIDAGHYGTEKFFAENLAAKLRPATGGKMEVIESAVNTDPFVHV